MRGDDEEAFNERVFFLFLFVFQTTFAFLNIAYYMRTLIKEPLTIAYRCLSEIEN